MQFVEVTGGYVININNITFMELNYHNYNYYNVYFVGDNLNERENIYWNYLQISREDMQKLMQKIRELK